MYVLVPLRWRAHASFVSLIIRRRKRWLCQLWSGLLVNYVCLWLSDSIKRQLSTHAHSCAHAILTCVHTLYLYPPPLSLSLSLSFCLFFSLSLSLSLSLCIWWFFLKIYFYFSEKIIFFWEIPHLLFSLTLWNQGFPEDFIFCGSRTNSEYSLVINAGLLLQERGLLLLKIPILFCLFLLLYFCGTEEWSQTLVHASHELYSGAEIQSTNYLCFASGPC